MDSLKEIIEPDRGYYNVQKDCITLEVWVNADAPHGTAYEKNFEKIFIFFNFNLVLKMKK